MNAIATFGLLGGGLQAGVAAYALRLHRFFGAQRVGWLIFAAFLFLALLHLLVPAQGLRGTVGINEVLSLLIVLLLIIGLAHAEALLTAHQRAVHNSQQLRHDVEQHEQQCAALTSENEHLRREIVDAGRLTASLENRVALLEPYHLLFTENPRAMCVFDPRSFRILAVNAAALRLYGFNRNQFMAHLATELFPLGDIRIFGNPAGQNPVLESEGNGSLHRRQDGALLELDITALDLVCQNAPARLIVAEDVTQRRQNESHLRQVAYLKSAQRAAGIIARHFNRPAAELHHHTAALLQVSPNPAVSAGLAKVSQATQRLGDLVRRVLMYTNPPALRLESVDLSVLLKSWQATLVQLADERVSMQMAPGANVPPMLADAELLKFVITNLVQNACAAMPQGGVLSLRTSTVQLGKTNEPQTHDAKPGEYVCLSVHDNGCGISPEVQAHLFEPFFSTKTSPPGLGLGLATVFTIVKQHSGWIEVLTQPQRGTQFKVMIPAAPRAAGPACVESPEAKGTGTILLVDGDDRIRGLVRHYLSRAGYRVIEAACGATATLLWESQHANVDLLLTDVALPGDISSGCTLAEQFKQSKPALKVVYTASRSQDGAPHDATSTEAVLKPFTSQTLLQAVKDGLNKGA